MRALAQTAVNAAFSVLGDDVTFYPAAGPDVTVRSIRVKGEEIVGLPFGSRAQTEGALFDVRIDDFDAEPAAGDVIESAEGEFFLVRSIIPAGFDVHSLVRRLDCVPGESPVAAVALTIDGSTVTIDGVPLMIA